MINERAKQSQTLNYLHRYIGLQSNGVVNNFIYFSPKPTKHYCHIHFRTSNALQWKDKCDEADIVASSKHKDRLHVSIEPNVFAQHKELIRDIVKDAVAESEA